MTPFVNGNDRLDRMLARPGVAERVAIINHAVWPEYVEVNKRYQCRMCHVWIRYDEGMGRWEHM